MGRRTGEKERNYSETKLLQANYSWVIVMLSFQIIIIVAATITIMDKESTLTIIHGGIGLGEDG